MGTCNHPYCEAITAKGKFCGRHWHALPEDIQNRLKQCKSKSEKGSLLAEARDYFEERMIGALEISTCRGRPPEYNGCGADIVWMTTRLGKNIPVNADSVDASDEQFDHQKHIAHWATCPHAASFRK